MRYSEGFLIEVDRIRQRIRQPARQGDRATLPDEIHLKRGAVLRRADLCPDGSRDRRDDLREIADYCRAHEVVRF
jgi:hypothetical protein